MNSVSVGDLSQHYSLRRYNADLKASLGEIVEELGTGEVADISSHLSGGFSNLSALERSLTLTDSYSLAIGSVSTFVDTQVIAFERARGYVAETGLSLIDASTSSDPFRKDAVLEESRATFDSVLTVLNAQGGGRSVFSGTATNSRAFASAEEVLNAFSSALAGLNSASDVMDAADVWFGSGGGYDITAYLGSSDFFGGVKVAANEVIDSKLSGDSDEIREILKVHAVAAALSEGEIPLIDAEVSNLMKLVGEEMLDLDENLIGVAAGLGELQERIVDYRSQNEAERFALMSAKNELIGVDVEDNAMRLSEAETQLEILYNVTARLSRLTLADYI